MLFDFIIRSRRDENDIESLTLLLRDIRKVVSNNHGKVIPVFDGISAYYAEKAYPKIHHVENLMRQLYAKFSIMNFGNTWASNIPKEIQDKAKSKTDINPLYSLDFIHIGDAIFDELPR